MRNRRNRVREVHAPSRAGDGAIAIVNFSDRNIFGAPPKIST